MSGLQGKPEHDAIKGVFTISLSSWFPKKTGFDLRKSKRIRCLFIRAATKGFSMTFQLAGNGPKIYEEVMVPLWFGRWAEALVDQASLGTSERVLDVACGTGVTTRLVKSKVGPSGKVVGLDINAPMLAKAKDLAGDLDIQWIESDVCGSGLPSESYESVLNITLRAA